MRGGPASPFAALCAVVFACAPMAAADAATAENEAPVRLGPHAVTGSWLERDEANHGRPLSVLTAEDLSLRGAGTMVEWLAALPQAGRVPITESQASGADARGDIGTVSLRGLGSGNTLVLLDGRRLAPHPIAMPEGTSGIPGLATNVNALPAAAIERVDVLRDGASALYGTDATAGVINVISRHELAAPQAGVRVLLTEHGGAGEQGATFSGGFRGPGATTLVFSYAFFHRDALRNAERDFSRNADFRSLVPAPWDGSTSDLSADLRSDRGFFGRFQRGNVNADGTVSGARPGGVTSAQVAANGTFHLVPTALGAATRTLQAATPDRAPASPVAGHYLNVNEFRFLLPSTTRHTLSLGFERGGPSVTVFGDALYYRADSRNQREPTRVDATADNNITLASDNPYNPFGARFYSPTGAPNADGSPRLAGTPSPVVLTRVTLPEFGPRRIDVRSENARLVAGLRGTLNADWKWESALLHAWARSTDLEANAIKESELRDALAGTTAATALNPFGTNFAIVNGALTTTGGAFSNPESVVAPLRGTFFREGTTTLTSGDVRVHGRWAGLAAGPVGVAAGGEWRRESYRDRRDAESGVLTAADVQRLGLRSSLVDDNNYLQVSPTADTAAHRTVAAAFLEVDVPLRHAPRAAWWPAVDFSAAARFEGTSDFGRTLKPRAGLIARVIPGVALRAGMSDSFRAPNLATLFGGAAQRSITGVDDAYRSTVTQSPDDGRTARRVSLRTGNRDLKPERARTLSAGVVLEAPALKHVTLGIDAWRIEQTDGFGRLDAVDILADDSARLLAANAAAAGRPLAEVDLSASGDPRVVRAAVTEEDRVAFATYNAGRPRAEQRAAVGAIRTIGESYLNAARRTLDGVDLALDWRGGSPEIGMWHAAVEVAWLHRFDEQESAGAPRTDLSWRDGNTRWKGSVTVDWRRGPWAASVFTTYTGRTQDGFFRTDTYRGSGVSADGFLIVDDAWLTNVSVTRQFGGGSGRARTTVRLGINNLFDTAPPFGLGASSDTDGYLRGFGDPRGRAISVEITRRF